MEYTDTDQRASTDKSSVTTKNHVSNIILCMQPPSDQRCPRFMCRRVGARPNRWPKIPTNVIALSLLFHFPYKSNSLFQIAFAAFQHAFIPQSTLEMSDSIRSQSKSSTVDGGAHAQDAMHHTVDVICAPMLCAKIHWMGFNIQSWSTREK